MNTINILSKLISFRTISETTNKELAQYISNYLAKHKIKTQLFEGSPGQFNLYARIGPNVDGGMILSGHTDVVPTEGQNWTTNPFELIKKKNKLFGRGSCDMKGFIAVVLNLVPKIKIKKLKKPLHLIFSYDEEVGCIGIQKLIPFLKKIKPKPTFCIVGEPTEMKLVNMHKGKKNFFVSFKGIESHSSLIENGVNAIDYCGEFINFLKILQKNLIETKNHKKFNPPYPTINIGKISGGIAVNIIPRTCELEFEIRDTPNLNTEKIIETIKTFLKKTEKKMKEKDKKCSIKFKILNNFPPLETNEKKQIVNLVLEKLKSNSISSVSFGTEAGVFNKIGFETIVCGPGSIEQAHKPNEYIEEKQLKKCEDFLTKIIDFLY
ncbi:MAG: acetylornithine deacetylase [Alphaproteobacteria bacterium]|nr:acetylornithine deacetylase [Alphaproteobacteria bacterium]